jgi:hypothetical protein
MPYVGRGWSEVDYFRLHCIALRLEGEAHVISGGRCGGSFHRLLRKMIK